MCLGVKIGERTNLLLLKVGTRFNQRAPAQDWSTGSGCYLGARGHRPDPDARWELPAETPQWSTLLANN